MPTDPFKAKQLERRDARNQCKMCLQVRKLPKLKIRQFLAAMNDDSIELPVISEVLVDWGVDVSRSSLQDHRARRTNSEGSGSRRDRCMEALERLAPPELTSVSA